MLDARALVMLYARLWADTPYQAECGVLSVVIPVKGFHSFHQINESFVPHFCIITIAGWDSGAKVAHDTNQVYYRDVKDIDR